MDKAHRQAQETRKTNETKRREQLLAYQRDRREIRDGLKTLITSETATPAEKLEAARLILELDKG